jgi:hypothetical protein
MSMVIFCCCVHKDRAGGIAIEALPAPVLSSIAGAIDVFC